MASTVASPGARKPSKRLGMPCEVCAVLKSNRLRSSKTDAMALAEWRGDLQSWSNPSERLGPALEVCTILKSDCFKDRCHGACQMDQSWSSDPQAVTAPRAVTGPNKAEWWRGTRPGGEGPAHPIRFPSAQDFRFNQNRQGPPVCRLGQARPGPASHTRATPSACSVRAGGLLIPSVFRPRAFSSRLRGLSAWGDVNASPARPISSCLTWAPECEGSVRAGALRGVRTLLSISNPPPPFPRSLRMCGSPAAGLEKAGPCGPSPGPPKPQTLSGGCPQKPPGGVAARVRPRPAAGEEGAFLGPEKAPSSSKAPKKEVFGAPPGPAARGDVRSIATERPSSATECPASV